MQIYTYKVYKTPKLIPPDSAFNQGLIYLQHGHSNVFLSSQTLSFQRALKVIIYHQPGSPLQVPHFSAALELAVTFPSPFKLI